MRGAGKGGRLAASDDLCRDLSGKRLRVANAEKKLAEWEARAPMPTPTLQLTPPQSRSKERELEALAEKHVAALAKRAGGPETEAAYVAAEAAERTRAEVAASLATAVDRGLAVEAAAREAAQRRAAAAAGAPAASRKRRMFELEEEEEGAEAEATVGPSVVSVLGVEAPAVKAVAQALLPEAVLAPCPAAATALPPPASSGAAQAAGSPRPQPPVAAIPAPPPPVDFSLYATASALEGAGGDALKEELRRRGVKCGGTVAERAARLWQLKDTSAADIPPKLRAK